MTRISYSKSSDIYSQLWRCSTARGSNSWLSLGGPTKVKAKKSFLFTEGSLKVEIKEHLFDFVVTLYASCKERGEHSQDRRAL